MSNIGRKGAEVIHFEAQQRKERAYRMNNDDPTRREGAIGMERDPETGEWTMKDESFWDFFTRFFEQKGEGIEREEAEQEKGLVRWEQKRERRAASGALATFGQVAGVGALGGLWTLGQVLKYSLLGWTLDANGMPRKDAAALKSFDDAYKATKERGIIGGIASGMGIAA